MKKFKILIWSSLSILTIGILTALYIYLDIRKGTVDITKSNYTLIKELDSPNGENTALALIYNCGATTDRQVTVVIRNSLLKNRATTVFWGNHANNIDIEWTDDSNLKIKHNIDSKDIYKSKSEFKEIKIDTEVNKSIPKRILKEKNDY